MDSKFNLADRLFSCRRCGVPGGGAGVPPGAWCPGRVASHSSPGHCRDMAARGQSGHWYATQDTVWRKWYGVCGTRPCMAGRWTPVSSFYVVRVRTLRTTLPHTPASRRPICPVGYREELNQNFLLTVSRFLFLLSSVNTIRLYAQVIFIKDNMCVFRTTHCHNDLI